MIIAMTEANQHNWEGPTSAEKSVLISPIAFRPTRNIIWIYIVTTIFLKSDRMLFVGINRRNTLEKRLFSIFWAIVSFRASGSVLWSIALLYLTHQRKSNNQSRGDMNLFWLESRYKRLWSERLPLPDYVPVSILLRKNLLFSFCCRHRTHLLSFIVYHKLETLPFSDPEHCPDIKPGKQTTK